MIMWYAWSPAAQLGQSLNLMHKENHALQSYAFREVLLYKAYIQGGWLYV